MKSQQSLFQRRNRLKVVAASDGVEGSTIEIPNQVLPQRQVSDERASPSVSVDERREHRIQIEAGTATQRPEECAVRWIRAGRGKRMNQLHGPVVELRQLVAGGEHGRGISGPPGRGGQRVHRDRGNVQQL